MRFTLPRRGAWRHTRSSLGLVLSLLFALLAPAVMVVPATTAMAALTAQEDATPTPPQALPESPRATTHKPITSTITAVPGPVPTTTWPTLPTRPHRTRPTVTSTRPPPGATMPGATQPGAPAPTASRPDTSAVSSPPAVAPAPSPPQPIPAEAATPQSLPHHTTATTSPILVQVGQITPAIAAPGTSQSITMTLTNTGSSPATDVVVRLGAGGHLSTRADLAAFLDRTPSGNDVQVGRLALATVEAGARTTFTMPLPASALPLLRSYGVLEMSVQVLSSQPTQRLSWVLPYQRRQSFRPTSLAFLAPLTTPADPAIVSAETATAQQAWKDALGSEGHLSTLARATQRLSVTAVLDPGIAPAKGTGSWAEPSSTHTTAKPTSSPPGTAANGSAAPRTRPPAPATEQEQQRTQYVKDVMDTSRVWLLPRRDPDVGALIVSGAPAATVRTFLSSYDLPPEPSETPAPSPTRSATTSVVTPRRTGSSTSGSPTSSSGSESGPLSDDASPTPRIAWIEGRPLTDEQLAVLRPGTPQQPDALVLSSATLEAADLREATTAARRTSQGTPVIAYDHAMSRALENVTEATATTTRQRLLSESLLHMATAPAAQRSLAVSTGRHFRGSYSVLSDLVVQLTQAPWNKAVPADDLLAAARSDAAPLARPNLSEGVEARTSTPSPLDQGALDATTMLLGTLRGLVSASQSVPPSTVRLSDDVLSLAATGWRGRLGEWQRARATVQTAVASEAAKVTLVINPSINFWSDTGEIPVTVTNGLPVGLNDLTLRVDTNENPSRLSILQQPNPQRINAGGSALVSLPVEAVGPGIATLNIAIYAPDGTMLTSHHSVRVRVQPVNGWVLTAAGIVLGVIFLAGLWRTLRRTPRVVDPSVEEQEEISTGALPAITPQDTA